MKDLLMNPTIVAWFSIIVITGYFVHLGFQQNSAGSIMAMIMVTLMAVILGGAIMYLILK